MMFKNLSLYHSAFLIQVIATKLNFGPYNINYSDEQFDIKYAK